MAQRRTLSNRRLKGQVAMWEQRDAPKTEEAIFSSEWDGLSHMQSVHGNDPNYGRPMAGSRTEFRGKQAGVHISNEVVALCRTICELGTPLPDGSVGVSFGLLFEAYTKISSKVVGILLRARRQKLVAFEGEMLYQRRDDDVIIRLLQMPDELEADIERRQQDLASHPSKAKH